jgi:hypothetical protein
MTPREIQETLAALGLYPKDKIDGIIGGKTRQAIDKALAAEKEEIRDAAYDYKWSDARKMTAFEQLTYKGVGIEVGDIDGLVGEQTRYARSVWTARISKGDVTKPVLKVETWRDDVKEKAVIVAKPKSHYPRQSGVPAFFGQPGTNQSLISLPIAFRIAWEPSKTVQRVSCNSKVADDLVSIWSKTLKHYGEPRFRSLRLDMFGGCLNVRKMRGGSSWSMHAYGIAWDVDPDRNQLKFTKNQATLDGSEYDPFWSIIEEHGWSSLGRLHNYDWMHFQATSTI